MADKITKPQSPIMNGDEGVYPLTTFDQIIMADGSRWNGKILGDNENAVTMEADGTETDQLVPVNAQTLDGLTYKQIIELEHGIGSFYFTMNASDDPNNKWNWMTWELVTDKFLLGAGNLYEGGTEGGEAEHTLTVDESPEHFHTAYADFAGGRCYPLVSDGGVGENITGAYFNASAVASTTQASKAAGSTSSGGSQPHNNMPPYLSIFMWTRVY